MSDASKIVDRVRKLLALAADGSGATEAEAQSAAAKAAAIMEEHGLAMATVAASGGEGEKRETTQTKGTFNWQVILMSAIAESCFCDSREITKRAPRGRPIRVGFSLIGRQSHVAGAQVLYDYLCAAVTRACRDAAPSTPKFFMVGVATRLAERVRERHVRELLRQQKETEARQREAAARATHPSAAPGSGTALAVTLVDYAQDEADANADLRRGLTPGTTRSERLASEARQAERRAKYTALVAEGVDGGVAWNMAMLGMKRERAEEYEREWQAEQKRESGRTHRTRRTWMDDARESSSYHTGRKVGEKIGLDQQIDGKGNRRLG